MGGKADALVCMRIADMVRMHPAQDDSRVCGECGRPVGIYPSGQRALREHPGLLVICAPCACLAPPEEVEDMPAADLETILAEARESFDVGKA